MITFGTNDRRYGTLAQLNTYERLACAPTAVTNALLALNLNGLLAIPDSPASHDSLFRTRAQLAEHYFHTSKSWENAGIAPGSPPSLTLSGTIKYIKDRRFEEEITVNSIGINKTTMGGEEINFAAFDVTGKINGKTITTPKLTETTPFDPVDKDLHGSRGIFDFLAQSLNLGPVIFGGYYPEGGGGHALLATKITINDENSNSKIERGEATLYFIDPLNPSTSYSPAIGGKISGNFNSIESSGAPNIIQSTQFWEGSDGFLKMKYKQNSLIDDNGILSLSREDSSNNRFPNGDTTDVNITLAMAINDSNIPENFGQVLGKNQTNTPGILNFNNLEISEGLEASSLSGNLYSNESSSMSNTFLFYEIENLGGMIKDKDQLTGETITYSPGDAGYAETAWDNAQSLDSTKSKINMGDRVSSDDATYTPFTVNIDQLSSGLLAPIVLTSEGNYWTSFSSGNSDGLQHFQATGNVSWKMEDQFNLGDADFNDLHVSLLATELA